MIPKLFDYIGFFGPIILSFITVLKLYKQQPYLIGYFIFLGGNVIVNHVLKHIILEERPSGGRSLINEPYNGMHKYGMPSSHAQSAFYSMTYLYLTKHTYKHRFRLSINSTKREHQLLIIQLV